MGVHTLAVEVAEAVVGLDDAAQLAVAGVVEAGVGGEHQKTTSLVSPADLEFRTFLFKAFNKQQSPEQF